MKKLILLLFIFLSHFTFAQQDLLPVKVEHQWGCIDYQGNIIITPTYEFIGMFNYGLAQAQKEGKLGVINTKNEVIVPFQYKSIPQIFSNFIVTENEARKQGLYDFTGKVILDNIYQRIYPLTPIQNLDSYEEMIIVQKKGLKGVVDKSGKKILEPKFSRINFFGKNNEFLLVQNYRSKGLYNLEGKELLPTEYDNFEYNNENYIWATRKAVVNKDTLTKLSLFDVKQNKIVFTSTEFSQVSFLDENHMEAKVRRGQRLYAGIYSLKTHKLILPASYHKIENSNRKGFFKVFKNKTVGIYDSNTQNFTLLPKVGYKFSDVLIINPQFYKVFRFQTDTIVIKNEEKLVSVLKEGIYEVRSKRVIISPNLYDRIEYDSLQKHFWIYDMNDMYRSYVSETDNVEDIFRRAGRFNGQAMAPDALGVLSLQGKLIVPLEYIQIEKKQSLYIGLKDDFWDIWTERGKQVIDACQDISEVRSNVAYIRKNNLYGLINTQGKLLMPPQYKKINLFEKKARFTNDDKSVEIEFDSQGNMTNFKELSRKVNTLSIHKEKDWQLKTLEKKKTEIKLENNLNINVDWFLDEDIQKYGLITNTGEIILPPYFDDVSAFSTLGYASVTLIEQNEDSTSSRKSGVIHKTGNLVIPLNYNYAFKTHINQEIEYYEVGLGEKRGIVGTDNKFVLPLKQYDYFNYVYHKDKFYLLSTLKNEKQGYIDTLVKKFIPPKFDVALPFEESIATVKYDDKLNFINLEGELISKTGFKEVKKFQNDRAGVKEDKFWGIINKSGTYVVPPKYDEVGSFESDITWVMKYEVALGKRTQKKYYFVDKSGQILNPKGTHDIKDFDRGVKIVRDKKSGKVGVQDIQENWIVSPKYSIIRPFNKEGLAPFKAKKGKGKWGLLDLKGNVVFKPSFWKIYYFHEGFAKVKLKPKGDKKFGFIDTKGKIITGKNGYFGAGNFSEGMVAVKLKKVPKKMYHFCVFDNTLTPKLIQQSSLQQQFYTEHGELFAFDYNNYRKLLEKKYGGKEVLEDKIKTSLDSIWKRPGYFYRGRSKDYQKYSLSDESIRTLWLDIIPKIGIINARRVQKKYYDTVRVRKVDSEEFEEEVKTISKSEVQAYKHTLPISIDLSKKTESREIKAMLRPYRKPENKWAYLNKEGKMVIPPIFQSARNFKNGYAYGLTSINNVKTWIHFNKKGDFFLGNNIAKIYADTLSDSKEIPKNIAFFQLGTRTGIKDKKDFTIVPTSYTKVGNFRNGYFTYSLDNLYGLQNAQGKVLHENIYQQIRYIAEGIFRFDIHGKIGYWSEEKGWFWDLQN